MEKVKVFLGKYGIYVLITLCLLFGLLSLTFRNATLDDDLYLWETSIMTEAISRGEWIGDYAVGTHGFLFKLPVSLIFLITGPSLEVATVWNVLLACLSLYLFYSILNNYFKKKSIALVGTFLLLTSFQFFLHIPTYMREIPVLLSVLIFIYLLQKKKSYWLIGLSLALIFDAKEYVWFMILPGFLIYILWERFRKSFFPMLWEYFKTFFKILLPTVVLLLLMVFTRVVPLNMYALSIIPGVTKGGVEYQLKHFDVELSTTNRIEDDAPSIQNIPLGENTVFEKAIDTISSYIGKLLYPRTFSFISVPKIIILPSILTSIFLFRKKLKKRNSFYISLSLIFFSFLLVFFLRASFDRYILPILPVIFFFYILFFQKIVKRKKVFLLTIFVSFLLAILGMIFEVEYVWIKILLNTLILSFYLLYLFYNERIHNLEIYILTAIGCITFAVVGYFFYANGQLRYYKLWGKDYQIKEVVSHFEDNEKILLNDVGWDLLPKVYRGDNQYNPEWKMELSDWVPRKKYLKMFEQSNTYGIFGNTVEDDRGFVFSEGIDKLGLMVSNLEGYTFRHQKKLEEYKNSSWLELIEVVGLKNTQLYIFKVIK